MKEIKKFFENSFAYPLVFIVLHIFTYGIFFWVSSYKLPLGWLSERRANGLNLIWFYDTFWPNWVGLFIISSAIFKIRKWKYSLLYLGALFCENYFIGWDYMGSYEEFPLTSIRYNVLETDLEFTKAGGHYILHFGLWLALGEVICKTIKMLWIFWKKDYT